MMIPHSTKLIENAVEDLKNQLQILKEKQPHLSAENYKEIEEAKQVLLSTN